MRASGPLVLVLVALAAGCGGGGGGGGGGGAPAAQGTVDPADQALLSGVTAANAGAPRRASAESAEIVALGRMLFFDKVLSGNRNISCATCHSMTAATGDALPVSLGEGAIGAAPARFQGAGRMIARNSQALFNAGLPDVTTMFWDGRVHRDPATGALRTPELLLDGASPGRPRIVAELRSALAAQAMFPVVTLEEMRGAAGSNEVASAITNEEAWTALMARLVGTANGTQGGIAGYRALFQAAYPSVASFDDLTFGHAARAIAAFQTAAFTALDSPFDRWLAGDRASLSAEQKRGGALFFGAARCASCHSGPLLSDLQAHALAVPQLGPGKFEPGEDRGRGLVTARPADDYRFRTPPLRNVAATAPYMHDGAHATLREAVRHHLDPAAAAAAYDPRALRSDFAATLDRDPSRAAARAAAIDPALGAPLALPDADVDALVAFLQALTDAGSLDLAAEVPAAVPSGLPVAD